MVNVTVPLNPHLEEKGPSVTVPFLILHKAVCRIQFGGEIMATNLAIDDAFIEEARRMETSGQRRQW
jgi:hypothetical protein